MLDVSGPVTHFFAARNSRESPGQRVAVRCQGPRIRWGSIPDRAGRFAHGVVNLAGVRAGQAGFRYAECRVEGFDSPRKVELGESNPAPEAVACALVREVFGRRIWPVGVTAGVTVLDAYRGEPEMETTDGSGLGRTTVEGAASEGLEGRCPWKSAEFAGALTGTYAAGELDELRDEWR